MKAARPIAVKGGFGDFLQCLPFMMAHPEHRYLVASHNDGVSEFFRALGIEVEELSLGRLNGAAVCPRRMFLDRNPFAPQLPIFTDGRPVVGVHLGGSAYSIRMQERFGLPSKALPLAVFEALVAAAPQYNFLLFGAADELTRLGVKETSSVRLVCDPDITVSLSRVVECSALIGSDSAFKTMSAMLRIPTIVWLGSYRDDFRDDNFIVPYVEAGVICVVRYWNLTSDEVAGGVNCSLEELRSVLHA